MKLACFCFMTGCGLSLAAGAPAYQEVFNFATVAGSPSLPGTSVDGTNSNAQFAGPSGAALDTATNLYVTDGNAIRRVAPIGTNWVVTTLAGAAAIHGTNDGTNFSARFDNPQGVAVDSAGNLYVADAYNNEVRKVTPVGTNWVVTTLAGLAGTNTSGSADGTNGNASFSLPAALAVDSATNLFVADTGNNTIRKVTPVGTNWVVTTVAGLAGAAGSANGTNADARFNSPAGIAVDTSGNLWVADAGNNTIRKLTLSWPLAASNYFLETTNEVSSTTTSTWSPLTNGILTSASGYSLTTNVGAPPVYFRLHKP